MQFLKLTTRLLMVSLVLICYTSCQKDNILYNEITPVQNLPEGESISLYQKQEVQKAVSQLLSDRRSLVRSFSANYEIDTTRVLKMKFNDEHTTYTLNIKHSYPGKLINLVFKEKIGQLSQPYVFEYHMSPKTVDRYYANQKQLLSYEGTIKQARFYDYFTEQSTRDNTDCGCFKNFVSIQTQIGGSNDPDNNPQDGTWSGNSGFPHFDPYGGFDPPTNGGGAEDCAPSIQIYRNLLWEYEMLLIRSCNLLVANFNTDCDNFDPGVGILFGQNNDLQNYMQHEHNPYSNIMLECLTNEIASKIDELKAQKLYDPCSGNEIKVDVDMLAKALCYGCIKSSGLTVQNLEDAYYEALAGVDYIDNHISNKRLNCLWERLMKNSNNVICDQISYFEGPTKLNLSIWSRIFSGALQSNEVTDLDQNGQVAIQFNENNLKDKCDIEIVKTMIHETVHAGILNVVLGTHINGWGIGNIEGLKHYYDSYSNFHHEYMAGAYFENLVDGLKKIFGNEYSDETYRAIMWSGLHHTSAYKQLPEIERKKIESIWDNFENSLTCKKSCL